MNFSFPIRFFLSFLTLILIGLLPSTLPAQAKALKWSENKLFKNKESQNIIVASKQDGIKALTVNIDENKGGIIISKSVSTINAQKDILRLSNEEYKQAVFNFEFGTLLEEIHFSILSYYAICIEDCDPEIRQSITILGLDENNNPVNPVYTYHSTDPESIEVTGSEISIIRQGQNEINVSFHQPLKGIKIITSKSKNDPDFYPYFEISPIKWLERGLNIEPNPFLNQEACEQWDIVFALDASSSIDKKEREDIQTAVSELLNYWEQNSPEKDVRVAIVEFDSEASVTLPFTRLTAKTLKEGLISKQLKKYRSSNKFVEGRTSWESALSESQNLFRGNKSNILFFITDGAPNLTSDENRLIIDSREPVLRLGSELKSQGVHIYGITSGDLNIENSKTWIGYITDGQKTQTAGQNQPVDYNTLDFVSTSSFNNSLKAFYGLLNNCQSSKELAANIRLKAYPNPVSIHLNLFVQVPDNNSSKAELIIEIKDILGKTISIFAIQPNSEFQLDVSNIPAGMYSVALKSSDTILDQTKVSISK